MLEPDSSTSEELEDKYKCGLFNFRPKCLQVFRNLYLFIAVMCLVSIMQTAISAGYLSSQITTLERRFSIDSSSIGLITSFFDIGFIISAVFVSFLGSHGRIPTWVANGMLAMCFGSYLMATPEWFATSFSSSNDFIISTQMCNNATKDSCHKFTDTGLLVKLIFMLGQFVIGAGSSPILSLGPTFIDDHVNPHLAAPLIALLYGANALGPVVGFAVGAVTLLYPNNKNIPPHAKPGDPQWIGAWWSGYILLGSVCIILGFILFFFPRKLNRIDTFKTLSFVSFLMKSSSAKSKESEAHIKSKKKSEEEPMISGVDDANYGKSVKDLPEAILSLISNKVYIVVCLAICFELFLVNGFASFLPKYIETEYKASNIRASVIAGSVIVPSAALGIVVGGFIMHKFKLDRKRAVLFSIFGALGVVLCMILFFSIGCRRSRFAGVFEPVVNKSVTREYIYINGTNYNTIDNKCVQEACGECNDNQFEPICDSRNSITYFSACHAGCVSTVKINKEVLFTNCSCIDDLKDSSNRLAVKLKQGECPLVCNNLWTFVVFVVVALFLTGITQNPLLMVTIRSVKKHERAFALGFQFVIMRLIAYIPSPMVYGKVIDLACVHWRKSKRCINNSTVNDFRTSTSKDDLIDYGDCLITDPVTLTNNLIGLSLTLKVCASVMYIILFFVLKKYGKDYPSPSKRISIEDINNLPSKDEQNEEILKVQSAHILYDSNNLQQEYQEQEQQPLPPPQQKSSKLTFNTTNNINTTKL